MSKNDINLKVTKFIKKEKERTKRHYVDLSSLQVAEGVAISEGNNLISRAMRNKTLQPFEIIQFQNDASGYKTIIIRYFKNQYWLIPANKKVYDYELAFQKWGFIDWKQNNYKYNLGDIVYLYLSSPYKKIGYKTEVIKTNQSFSDCVDDSLFWIDKKKENEAREGKHVRLRLINSYDNELLNLENLLQNGLKSAPQGAQKIKAQTLKYINKIINEHSEKLDERIDEEEYYEGAMTIISNNKYERNLKARQACLDHYGYKCNVCNFDFSQMYGELGKNYIQVHHITPLSQIRSNYKINPITDLIPICANCHVMIHLSNEILDHNELKKIIKK